ncbi:MAG: hypothetical protein ACI865_002456 [Flavobacteriaceae bacterium]|jgi:hypothetical protein
MKRINIYILLVIATGGILGFIAPKESDTSINQIIGDTSYEKIVGMEVPANAEEQDRIQIHLAYVEYILRKKGTANLTETQKTNRANALNLLHDYWVAGKFPSNLDYPDERKPCFRDRNGNICAVGHLVDKTGNSSLVDDIEREQNYDYIFDIESLELAEWIAESGLSNEECAMIQPTYGYQPSQTDPNYVQPSFAISTAALSGTSLAISLLSISQLNSPGRGRWILPAVGATSGISQIVLGAIYYKRSNTNTACWDWNCPPFYQRSQNLSLLNMGIGTFSTALNTFALVRQLRGQKKHKDISWNMYGYQTPSEDYAIGLNFIKRF